ncbi:serine/threonine-protein kinase [Nocardia sp. NPDC050412]
MVERLDSDQPARIGRYRLLGQLGAGGMGRVFLGIGPDGRPVAIKQVHPHLVEEDDFLPRFRREVQTSARVSGAFTAAVVDFDVDSEMPWLASVFVPGLPLDKAVAQFGPLPVDQVRFLAVGLASALTAIHRIGLIHRDLKPANIILAQDGPRVIDFGIARAVEGRSELTQTGSIIGSPAFMSPEQAQSMPLTPASDVFAFGAVIAMAAGGKSPFAGASMPHTLYNIVHTDPDLTGLPSQIRQLVEPCLRKEPGARPTTAQILDYLGPMPQAPNPWSSAVHGAIRQQAAELSALTSDPESTQIVGVPSAGTEPTSMREEETFEQRLRRLEVNSWDASSKRDKRSLVIAALVALVLLIGTGIGVGVMRSGDGPANPAGATENPLSAMNLTQLRLVDLCGLMNKPFTAVGEWKAAPYPLQWGSCTAKGANYNVELWKRSTAAYQESGKRIDGVPVLEDRTNLGHDCTRGLVPAKMEPQFGLFVQVNTSDSAAKAGMCEAAESAMAEVIARLRSSSFQLLNVQGSLARLDACALVSPTAIKFNVGAPSQGVANDVYSCKWTATNVLTLKLDRAARPDLTSGLKQIDVEGLVGYRPVDDPQRGECSAQYAHRTIDQGLAEVVTVRVSNQTVDPERLCTAAAAVLKNVVSNLPPR